MKPIQHIERAVLALLGLALLQSCDQEPIRIAIMTKLDAGSIIGSSEVDAARHYAATHPELRVEFVPVNDAWDPAQIPRAWEEVRKQGIGLVITSHTSTCAVELKKLSDTALDDVTVMVTGSTTNLLSGLPDNNIRMVQDVDREQESIAAHLKSLGLSHLVILRDLDNARYTEPALKAFQGAYGTEVPVLDISVKQLDMEKVRTFLAAGSFDGVYTLIGGNQTASGSLGQLAWSINPGVKVFFTPWNNASTILETAADSIQVSTMASHYPPRSQSPATDAFIKSFQAAYGYTPTYNSLHVYRAIDILSQAIKAGQRTPKDIREWMLEQKRFETVFGPLVLDEYGDTDMPLYFITDIPREFE